MAYQQGLQVLVSGEVDVDVVFDIAFDSAPDIIIPHVENVSADALKLLIVAEVVAKSTSGFTVRLDGAPNTGNYKLAWVAGSAALMYQAIAQIGRKISALNEITAALHNDDYFPLVHTIPSPVTKRVKLSTLRALFPNLVVDPPASPAAPGTQGQISVDGDFLYAHNGTLWGRSRMFQSAWDVTAGLEPEQRGSIALVENQSYIEVEFDTEFAAIPQINFSFSNVETEDKTFITGLLTEASVAGFRVELSTPPPSGNYLMTWNAAR